MVGDKERPPTSPKFSRRHRGFPPKMKGARNYTICSRRDRFPRQKMSRNLWPSKRLDTDELEQRSAFFFLSPLSSHARSPETRCRNRAAKERDLAVSLQHIRCCLHVAVRAWHQLGSGVRRRARGPRPTRAHTCC